MTHDPRREGRSLPGPGPADRLRAALDVADEVAACGDLDSLYRRAVELARARLGVERCSIHRYADGWASGTYGTDLEGQTTDEHAHRFAAGPHWASPFRETGAPARRWHRFTGDRIHWHNGAPWSAGEGWIVNTPIRTQGALAAVFTNDAAITNRPFDPELQEVLAVYCSLLGHLSERIGAEQALRASEERYRTVFEAVNDGLLVRDLDGRAVTANEAFCRMHGYTLEQLATLPPTGLVHPDCVAIFEHYLHELQAGRSVRVESRNVCRDGSVVDVEVSGVPVELGGRPHLIGAFRDVTQRKRAEAALRRLAAAAEQAGEAILITDRRNRLVYVNPAFERQSGYTGEEALGRSPNELLRSGDPADEATREAVGPALRTTGMWRGRLLNRNKAGDTYPIDCTISAVRDEQGEIVSFVSIDRDMTQELRLEEQLRQASKMEAIGRLAGGVAHDFNNLLTTISGYAELALSQLPEGGNLFEDVRQIHRAADRAAELTRQLLAFGRRQVIAPRPVHLNEVVADMEKMLGRLIGEDIALVCRLADDLGETLADPGQLAQIIMNLAVNARDAMPDGGELRFETANVTLGPEYAARHLDAHPGEYVRLTVADTGCGMDAATQARMFEPFFTTKPFGQGTGLGLATVYGVVAQNGGHVACASALGGGTTFHIHLPRIAASAVPVVSEAPTTGGTGSETILLVEDEATVAAFVARALGELGYQVLTAADGEAAIRLVAQAVHVDLLVSDVILPGLNGQQLAERLTALRPGLPVLFISGYPETVIAEQGVLAPGVNFLQKPFRPAVLAARIRELLDAR